MSLKACTLCLAIVAMPSLATAQDVAGLFGTWEMTATFTGSTDDCGNATAEGELRVLQRITMKDFIAYQGRLKTVNGLEFCAETTAIDMGVLLVVDGAKVVMNYEDPEWWPDRLHLKGDLMEGSDETGTKTRWVRLEGPNESRRAAEVKTFIAQRAYGESSADLRELMLDLGQSDSEVEALLWAYFDRAAGCEVDTLRAVATEQALSFYELVNVIDAGITNTDLHHEFDSQSYYARTALCLEELQEDLNIP